MTTAYFVANVLLPLMLKYGPAGVSLAENIYAGIKVWVNKPELTPADFDQARAITDTHKGFFDNPPPNPWVPPSEALPVGTVLTVTEKTRIPEHQG